jgi:hypothetical protein
VILRDPVQRAYSHYQMTADTCGTSAQLEKRAFVAGKSFQDIIDEDLAQLQPVLANPTCTDTFQTYLDQLPRSHGAHAYLGRGLYALQLRIWFNLFPREQFLLLRLEDMVDRPATQTTMDRVCTFLGLKTFRLDDMAPQNARTYAPMPAHMKATLEAFYAPFNADLAAVVPDFHPAWTYEST